MSVIRITEVERLAIIATRPAYGSERTKAQRDQNRAVFQRIKQKYGVPTNQKIKVEIDAKGNPDYLVLKNKDSGRAIEDLANRTGTPISAPAWAEPPRVIRKVPAVEPMRFQPAPAMAPAMPKPLPAFAVRVGSINLEDAMQLLRSEGDACDSFATSVEPVEGTVSVKNGRLYFVV